MLYEVITDINFRVAFAAFEAAAQRQGDTALHVGPTSAASAREQDNRIRAMVKQGVDGLAVSVIHSQFLFRSALGEAVNAGIPVVTFDSDFTGDEQAIRATYIGPDNYHIGTQLALLAKERRPQGGNVWLLSSGKDSNLLDRIQGLRAGLSYNFV